MNEPTADQVRAVFALMRWAITEGSFAGSDVDGGELQDRAVMAGVLVPHIVTAPCGDNCNCAEWDDLDEANPQTCYRLADWLKDGPP